MTDEERKAYKIMFELVDFCNARSSCTGCPMRLGTEDCAPLSDKVFNGEDFTALHDYLTGIGVKREEVFNASGSV